jgi:hypothetical protein
MPAGIPPAPPCSCAMRFARIAASSEPVAFEQKKARSVRPCIKSFVKTPGLTCCEHNSLLSMFEATGAVWKRRRKPVATKTHAALLPAQQLKQQQFETARAKVSRQRWNRAASSTSSAPQAQRYPNRTAIAHWRLVIASDSVQDAAEQWQRLDPAGHNLQSS